MKQKWSIAAALMAVVMTGCQRESTQPPDQTTTPVPAQPQSAFHEVIEGFLTECNKANVKSPKEMAERLGIAALRKREESGEDPETMDRSQWHPVLREITERTHEKHPYEAIKRTYVDRQSPHRQEAILLLKVMGYKCAETEALPD